MLLQSKADIHNKKRERENTKKKKKDGRNHH
jgi:hypothetical protein